MDQISLPMAPDLEVFPRLVRWLILGTLAVFVGGVLLVVIIGLISV